MKPILTLTEHGQLKSLSDPIRAEIMMRLIEKPHTGQMLSEKLNLSRAKIHYHLKELEKNNLIKLVKKEEKGGVMQKFYQSVARGFSPSTELLPHVKDVSESSRQLLLQMAEKNKKTILSAPENSFQLNVSSENPSDWGFVGSMWQVEVTDKQFKEWIKKYFKLMGELRSISRNSENTSEDKKYFYISTMAFEIDELIFEEMENENGGD
ncbi:winged helix-turn-helix domain-containing protein [Aquibacillus koreensis]|uniref:Winged helix-turn-helix domain-containing protein n=1 Tax=Aquibacillus koreensis TaxID=279446 RepID=A0A9X3WIL2_9BACI|nr:winged helix-turn-helix domain-containing protein [Aquibacillus koreensis]MCT2534766.1 winged helix-turn-helix domain-containing protein [Aquibacillus koreensis]MDC3419623.1 winged helix-turn-helix domain-containing protein [Aquibacillus koreensis]